MPSPQEQVAKQFGITREDFNVAAQSRNTPGIDPMRDHIHEVTQNRAARRRERLSLNARTLDVVHQDMKRIAAASGVSHATLLSELTNKLLAEDSDDADEGDGDVTNAPDDEADLRAMEDQHLPGESTFNPADRSHPTMKSASPAPRPSPVDRTTGADSPRYLSRHGRATMRIPNSNDKLLLNVSAREFNAARRREPA